MDFTQSFSSIYSKSHQNVDNNQNFIIISLVFENFLKILFYTDTELLTKKKKQILSRIFQNFGTISRSTSTYVRIQPLNEHMT